MKLPKTTHPPARLLHRGIRRVEVFDYAQNDLGGLRSTLADLAADGYRSLSLHAPMPRPGHFPYSGIACFFLNEEAEKREISFRMIQQTLALAREWKAEYVVTHLTYGPADSKDPRTAQRLAHEACGKLAVLSRSYAIPIYIEYAAYSSSFHQPRQFVSVVGVHSELGVCVDVGHAFLGARLRRRSYEEDLEILSRHVRSVHLWNTKNMGHHQRYGHTPLHPSQSPREGWIDIRSSLEIILRRNPSAAVVFEYPARRVTPKIREGYDWVEKVIGRIVEKAQTGDGCDEALQGTAR